MKRPIKFRGHAIYDSLGRPVDKIVYGDLTQSEYAIEIWDNGWGCDADSYVVDPESVAQLVGFDRDGNEVYEGDIVTNFLGEEFTAEILDGVVTSEGNIDDLRVEVLKLKESVK